MKVRFVLVFACSLPALQGAWLGYKAATPAAQTPTALDSYVRDSATQAGRDTSETLPGAIWSPSARLSDLGRDLRASQVDDVLTIVIGESVSAVAGGASSTQRTSSANASVTALAKPLSATSALANLANLGGASKLDGQGTTSRTATLNTTLTVRVAQVLPGGLLLIEGSKSIQVNSEQQVVTVRGVVRTADISTSNSVASTQVADMEVRVNGNGVVADAVRRPNALYRLLLGLLPY